MIFFEFAAGWLLGMFTQSFTDDGVAITLCRMDLLDLEKLLESMRRAASHRRPSDDLNNIKEIKEVLRILNVHYAGLFIKFPELHQLVELSLERISDMEKNPYDSKNVPSFVGIALANIWGYYDPYSEITKIKEIQYLLHAGFIKRSWTRLKDIIKCKKQA